jgi:tetratricopeptide (TPR) repeat protein
VGVCNKGVKRNAPDNRDWSVKCPKDLWSVQWNLLVIFFTVSMIGRIFFAVPLSKPSQQQPQHARSNRQEVNNIYLKGMKLLHDKQYAEALGQFRLLEQLDPRDPQGFAGEGIALALLGKPQEAVVALKMSLVIDPSFWVAQRELGILYWHLNQKGPAARELLPLAHLFPDDAVVNVILAQYSFEQKNYAKALHFFSQAPAQVASDVDLSLMEASAFLKIGNEKRGNEILQRLTERPGLPNAERFQLAWVLGEAQNYKAAIKVFCSLSPNFPNKFHHDYGLALAYFEDGQYTNCVRVLKGLESRGDMSPEAYSLLGVAEEKAGHTEEAYDSFRKGILTYPNKAQNYLNIGALSCKHLNYGLAVRLLTSGIERVPDPRELVLSRGIAFTLAGNFEAAEKDLNHAIEMDRDNPQSYFSLGLCLLEAGDLNKAAQAFQEASERSPKDMWPYFYIAETLIQKGVTPGTPAFRRAREAVEKAISLKLDFAYAYRDRAKLELQNGNTQQAVADLEQAHGLAPESRSLTYMLARTYEKVNEHAKARVLLGQVERKSKATSAKDLRREDLIKAIVVISKDNRFSKPSR